MKTMITMSGILLFAGFSAAPAFADCSAAAEQTAAEQNGRLVKVTPAKDKNGRDICVVVISVPSTEGEKPRRVEIAVPVN